ncbi:MAG TPA: hypothetical protein DIT18_16360 [Pseudomonas sp.]|nr:hypothetical protein [Pseudomonas sp.]
MKTPGTSKAPGSLDPDFGNDGVAPFPVALNYAQTQLLSDGKILTAGSAMYSEVLTLVRHLSTGAVDESFGERGVAYIAPPFSREITVKQVWVLPDDRAVIHCGLGNFQRNTAVVLRVLPDGTLDTSFGVAGYCLLDMGGNTNNIPAMGVLSDGKIILSLLAEKVGSLYPWNYLVRLDNGHLDTSFGPNGSGMIHIGEGIGRDLVVLPDDRVLLVQSTTLDYTLVVLQQFLADGRPDPAFGDDGAVTLTLDNGRLDVSSLVRQADGKIVAVGGADAGSGVHMLITRLNVHGSRDTTFNNGELQIVPFAGFETEAQKVTLQPDGKIVMGGSSVGSVESANFVLMRFLASGALDTSFGDAGQVMTNFSGMDACTTVELQDDGKLLASGPSSLNQNGVSYIVARYLG